MASVTASFLRVIQEEGIIVSFVISCSDIHKTYSSGENIVRALQGVNLHIEPGTMTAIMGPSGCGKSTLLNVIGLVQPFDSGELLLGENKTKTLKDSSRAKLRNEFFGYLVQDFALVEADTVWANVTIPLLYASREQRKKLKRRKIAELLAQVDIEEKINEKVKNLSGGQRQRVALARALVNEPEVILADEPTGQLDHENAMSIMSLLRRQAMNGKTILLVTHDSGIAGMCDQVIQMREGVLV